jgi:transposase InsO family protein
MKFGFIHAEKAYFPIAALCRLLGVSRQGYYAYATRPPSARTVSEQLLGAQVQQLFEASEERYGSPRVLRELKASGWAVGKRRVERAMRGLGLTPPMRRRHKVTTRADITHTVAPNELARDFTATRPNERWVTDITYVWTDEGWSYCAAILDLFSRSVVGWAVGASLSTALPLAALDMAIGRRRPGRGLVHHSDRGCQYTSAEYRAQLSTLGVTVSMSRKGNCWDNAVAESFFATLKKELVHRRSWPTRALLRDALFDYIEVFYNRRRLHSTIGYKTPAQAESDYALVCAA